MGSDNRKYRAAVAALDALYAELPTVACRGLCGVTCGAVPLTDVEARRLQVTTHRKPRTILLATPVVDVNGDTRHERCVYLSAEDRCTAYPRGCIPDRWLADRAFVRLAQAIERVGGDRLLVTTPAGLAVHPSGSFQSMLGADAGRPDALVDADAERTRSLRALHGGRIIGVVKNN